MKRVISKIKTEGLSQTLEKVFSKLDTPIPLGYSCAGTIVESATGEFKSGDRVACAGAGHATHAEFNVVPKNLLVPIPDAVSFEDACFTSIGAIAIQGVRQADIRLGERVVVIGLGLLGLLTVQILKAAGCSVLGSDRDAVRVELARQLGADEAVATDLMEASAAFTKGRGADAVIITAATPSNEPIETAGEISRAKGRVVVVGMVGMDVPRDPFYKKELDLRLSMSLGPGRYDNNYEEAGHDYPFAYVRWTEQRNMQSFLDLVATGKVTPAKLITHRFDIADALGAYEMMVNDHEKYLGMVISYPSDSNRSLQSRTIELRPESRESHRRRLHRCWKLREISPDPIAQEDRRCGTDRPMHRHRNERKSTATKHGFAYSTTDAEKILRDARINTVFIATRHNLHASIACAAIAAGKNVFLEKPMCVRVEEIGDIESAIALRATSARLMVGFNRRFSPHSDAIREFFTSRGTPMFITYRINAGFVPKDSWLHDPEVGGGRIVGELCHFVDWCESITGSTPIDVRAAAISSNDSRQTTEDSVAATIRYADGSVAAIQYVALGASSLPKERAEVFADGKIAVMDDFVTTTFHGDRRRPLEDAPAERIRRGTRGARRCDSRRRCGADRLCQPGSHDARHFCDSRIAAKRKVHPHRKCADRRKRMNLPRLLHTVRHCARRQIRGQIVNRLRRAIEDPAKVQRWPAPVFPGRQWNPVREFLPPNTGANSEETIRAGTFVFLNRSHDCGFPPDWTGGELPKLWRYNLHYHEFLWLLSFDDAVRVIDHWIANYPPAQGAIGWEPYPTSLRLMNWCMLLWSRHAQAISNHPAVEQIWSSVYRQAEWLRRHLETHLLGNHLLENAAALAMAGSCFYGDAAARWLRIGIELLREQLAEQVLPDGGHFERSPMYHSRVAYVLAQLHNTGNETLPRSRLGTAPTNASRAQADVPSGWPNRIGQ